MKNRKFMKKLVSSVASIALSLLLVIGFSFAPVAQVSAYVGEVDVLAPGEPKNFTWSSDIFSTPVTINETGFYQIEVTDNNYGSSYGLFVLGDYTTDSDEVFMIVDYPTQKVTSEALFLIAGHDYQIEAAFMNLDSLSYASGNITVTLTELDYSPAELTASSQVFDFEGEEPLWFGYTTQELGDYTLTFTEFSAYIDVYNAQTGEKIYSSDTEWCDSNYNWYLRTKLVFNFSANTKYYFVIDDYEPTSEEIEQPTDVSLQMTKNAKTVSDINVKSCLYHLTSWDYIDESYFDYSVSYTDNTTQTFAYDELCLAGITTPEIYVIDEYTYLNDQALTPGGKITVIADYENRYQIFYLNVESVTDYLISEGICATDEYDECLIEYESKDEHTYWWRIKPSSTGSYGVYTSGLVNYFDWWSIEIIDSQNNIVAFDEETLTWPLIDGDEYALCFSYQYLDGVYDDVDFYLKKDASTLFPDTAAGDWYNDAVHYVVGSGIMGGYGSGYFGTADGIQRQDFLVMLSRLDGVNLDAYDYESAFPDVPRGSYYEAAINWGYEHGIVTGYENGEFGVGDKITREQIVTFLYRYANYRYADTDYTITEDTLRNTYSDYGYVNDYAKEPMLWAVENGVINGKTPSTIVPYGDALRCEIAKIMYNIFENDVI